MKLSSLFRTLGCAAISLALPVATSVSPASADANPPTVPTLRSVEDDFAALSLAPIGRRVTGGTVSIGGLAVTIDDGTVVPIVGARGDVLGVFVTGAGSWRYAASGPAEIAALATNVERMASSLRVTDDRVVDRFTTMFAFFAAPLWNEIWDPDSGSGSPEAAPASRAAVFADMLRLAQENNPEFDFRAAQARLNGRGRFVYVEFDGGSERVGYSFDDVLLGRERLFTFRKLSDWKIRFEQTLSSRTIPATKDSGFGRVALVQADIAIDTADNKRGTIASDLTLRVGRTDTRLLSLLLLNHRDPDSIAWDSPKNRLEVTLVTDAEGRDLPFLHKYGELLVEIPATTKAEQDVRIRVETQGEVFLDMNDTHVDNYFIFHGQTWFPSPVGWASERFSYTLKVRTKKPWRPVTSGHEVSFQEDGGFYVAESRADHPSNLIAVLGGKYVTSEATVDGLKVRVHAYAMSRKEALEALPHLTAAFAKFYEKLLGPMPADELDVVEIPEYGFGIAPSGIVLMTTEAYKPRYEYASYFTRGVNARLAHEVAHQWFGHRAVPADLSDRWLAESLAEYFSGLAMGALASDKDAKYGFPQMLASWRGNAPLCADRASMTTAYSLGGEQSGRDRFCLLYDRGPLVLHMLRTMIGNERFLGATKSFLESGSARPVTTEDFSKAVSKAVGQDMSWFFEDWVASPGTPEVKVTYAVGTGHDGGLHLSGKVSQSAGAPFKRFMLPFILDNGGRPDVRLLFVDEREKAFDYQLPAAPRAVQVDPSNNNLVTYR